MTAQTSPTVALAERAREAQRLAPVGSLRRKGAGVLAVLLDAARTVEGAGRMLTRERLPAEIRQTAAELLDELTTNPEEGTAQ